MSFDSWMLALHVLSAFAWVAGLVLFWVLVVAMRQVDTAEETIRMQPMVTVGNAAVGIGMGGTILLGLWLAFSFGDYELWDGWIIAALVLWAVSAGLGRRAEAAYTQAANKARDLQRTGELGANPELLALNRTTTGVVFQSLWSLVVFLILVDMIWKPGA